MNNDILKACNGGATPTVDLTQGLVAHYLLNNNPDDCHGIYDGTAVGGVDFQGDMAKLDGVDDYISFPQIIPPFNTLISPYTISMWCKIKGDATLSTALHIVQRDEMYKSVGRIGLYYNVDTNTTKAGISIFGYKGTNSTFIVLAPMLDVPTILGEPINIVVSYTRTYADVYVNSIYIGRQTYDYTLVDYDLFNISLGRTQNQTFEYFKDEISNFRVYNEAKSQTFIDALYAEGYYPKPLPLPTTVGLVAHYPLTGTVEDATGNYNGTENSGLTYVDDAEFGSVVSINEAVYFNTPAVPLSIVNGGWSYQIFIDSWYFDNYDAIFSDTITSSTIAHHFGITSGGINNVIHTYWNGTYCSQLFDFVAGQWYDIEFRYNTSGGQYFINGVEYAFMPKTEYASLPAKSINNIGRQGNKKIKCRLRNLTFYNTYRTNQEIIDRANYEKNFRPIDIDDTLSTYLPLSQSALDNYYNQYDATASVGVTFDGNKATIPTGASITYPNMPTTYKTLTYIHDNLFHNVILDQYTHLAYRTWLTALLDNFNNCTLEEVRTFDTILSDERLDILSKVKDGVVAPEIITANTTWVSPVTKTITVIVIGGGGGGSARDTGTSATAYYDAGGEHGVIAEYSIVVVKGQSYPIVIGAGGVGAYRVFNTGYAGGGTGGTSSFDTTYTASGGGCPYLNLLTSSTRNLYRESVRGHIDYNGFLGVSGASRAVAQNSNFVGDAGMGFGVGGGSLNNTYHTSGSARGGAGANGAVIILI